MALDIPRTPSHGALLPAGAAPAVPGGGREDLAGTRLARSCDASGAGVRANFSPYLGLLVLLLPRQKQYDLLNLSLFPSGSSSAVCVREDKVSHYCPDL